MKTQRKSGARKNRARKNGAGNEGVTLVGLGNWGTALASALFAARIPIREIVVRTLREPDRRLAKQWKTRLVTLEGARHPAAKLDAKLDAPILWICTPDAEIASVAAALARSNSGKHGLGNSRPSHPVVLHSSGALDSTELAALRDMGASLASAHPLMSFPRRVAAVLCRSESAREKVYGRRTFHRRWHELSRRITVGADKAADKVADKAADKAADKVYDMQDFVTAVRELQVTPPVTKNENGRRRNLDRGTTRHAGYALSLSRRWLVEKSFGWLKQTGPLRQVKLRGLEKVDWLFVFSCAAHNLLRLPRLMAQRQPARLREQCA